MKAILSCAPRSLIIIILIFHLSGSFSQAIRNLVDKNLTGMNRASVSVATSTDSSAIGMVYLDYIPGSYAGEGKTLYFSIQDSTGVMLVSDNVLRPSDGTSIYDPFILGISDSNFIACFTSTSSMEIHAAIFDKNGNIIKSDFQVSAASGAGSCSISYLTSGNFVIFWTDNYHIRFQIFDNSGTPQRTEYAENYPELIEKGCSCEAFSNNEFFCAFSKLKASTYGIYGQKFSSNGNKVGSLITINDDSSYNEHFPKVKIIDSSNFLVCYIVDGVSPTQLRCRNFANSRSVALSASKGSYLITSSPMPAGFQPSDKPIEVVASNRVQIAVNDMNGNIYSYRVKTDGKSVGKNVKINDTSSGCSNVNLVYVGHQLLYFWTGQNQSNTDIILKKVSNFLTCSNYPVSVIQSHVVDLDFTNYIIDPINLSVTVNFQALPSVGTIQKISDGSLIIINTPYGITDLKYVAGSSPATESIRFIGVNSASEVSTVCTVDVTISSSPVISSCYLTCGTCSSLGDSTDNKCTTCIEGSTHALSGQTSQCLESAPQYYYLNSSEDMYKPCYETCETCKADPTPSSQGCLTCRSGYIQSPKDSAACIAECNLPGGEKWYINDSIDYICTSQCPISRPFYIELTLECVNECRGNLLYNKKCVDSCPPGSKQYLNTMCYDTCPQYTVTDNINSKCLNCKSSGQYYYKSQCFNTLPDGTVQVDSDFNAYVDCYASCSSCSDVGDQTENKCLTCKQGYYPISDKISQCLDNPPLFYYFTGNVFKPCYQTCNSCTGDGSQTEHNCITCANELYLFNGNCINSCPLYTNQNATTKSCINCKSKDQFYYNGSCVNFIPGNSQLVNSEYNAYVSCTDLNLFIFNGQCVANCPDGLTLNTIDNTCSTCKEIGKYSYKSSCNDKCPDNVQIDESNKICTDCKDLNMFLFNGQCVASCPDGLAVNTMDNTCSTCKAIGKYSYKSSCYDECPPDNVKIDESNKICTDCKDLKMFLYLNECIPSCPVSYIQDYDFNICVQCPTNATYTLNGVCLEFCPANMVQDSGSMTCVNCKDSGTYKLNDACIKTCPKDYGSDEDNLCQLCEDGDSKYSYNGKCVGTCPEGYINNNQTLSCEPCESIGISSNITCSQCKKYYICNHFLDSETIGMIQNLGNLPLNETTKDKVKAYIADLIKMNQTYAQTLQTSNLSIQISNSSEIAQEQTLQDALKYHLSIVDFSACEKKLRSYYNISDDKELAYSKIDFKTTNNSVTTSSISYEVYGPTGEQLNTSVCKSSDIEVMVNIPLTNNNSLINMTSYSALSDVVDIYNSSAEFYNSRCVAYSTEQADIPLNDRRTQMYSGYDAVCSTGCKYDGLNATTNYVKCSCTDVSGEMTVNFIENLLDLFSTINLDIITCYTKTLETPQFYTNYGFYTLIGAAGAAAVISALSLLTDQRLLNSLKGLDSLYNNDSGILDDLNEVAQDAHQITGNISIGPPACPPRNLDKTEEPNRGAKGISTLDRGHNTERTRKNSDHPFIVKSPNKKETLDQDDMAYLKKLGQHTVRQEDFEASPSVDDQPPLQFQRKPGSRLSSKMVTVKMFKQVVLPMFDENTLPNFHTEKDCLNNNFTAKGRESQVMHNEDNHIVHKVLSIQQGTDRGSFNSSNSSRSNTNDGLSEFTRKDYFNMNYFQAVLFDRRNFFQCMWDHLLTINYILSTFFYDSLLIPKYLRIILFFFALCINFFTNAAFYVDSYITDRSKHPSLNMDFGYTFTNEFLKCSIAAFFASFVKVWIIKIVNPPEKVEKEFSSVMKTKEKEKVKTA